MYIRVPSTTVAGFCELATSLLNQDFRADIVDVGLELLWNLLELDPEACSTFGNEENFKFESVLLLSRGSLHRQGSESFTARKP